MKADEKSGFLPHIPVTREPDIEKRRKTQKNPRPPAPPSRNPPEHGLGLRGQAQDAVTTAIAARKKLGISWKR
ncbi:MAG: hypothetical protein L6R30_23165 [Thermoanaerobaculia bacterium]|nr:hypothetical protein [Thermoanaerobaculia bacterium]